MLTDAHKARYAQAWERLERAIGYEVSGDMTKCEMSLRLACKWELEALGFVPWNALLK